MTTSTPREFCPKCSRHSFVFSRRKFGEPAYQCCFCGDIWRASTVHSPYAPKIVKAILKTLSQKGRGQEHG